MIIAKDASPTPGLIRRLTMYDFWVQLFAWFFDVPRAAVFIVNEFLLLIGFGGAA